MVTHSNVATRVRFANPSELTKDLTGTLLGFNQGHSTALVGWSNGSLNTHRVEELVPVPVPRQPQPYRYVEAKSVRVQDEVVTTSGVLRVTAIDDDTNWGDQRIELRGHRLDPVKNVFTTDRIAALVPQNQRVLLLHRPVVETQVGDPSVVTVPC